MLSVFVFGRHVSPWCTVALLAKRQTKGVARHILPCKTTCDLIMLKILYNDCLLFAIKTRKKLTKVEIYGTMCREH
ncbi:MAG TPA: hypothetical protein DHU79_04645 [Clostridiales bacterium]|nr:hypothetical protein [Clostridiales bacterium]